MPPKNAADLDLEQRLFTLHTAFVSPFIQLKSSKKKNNTNCVVSVMLSIGFFSTWKIKWYNKL